MVAITYYTCITGEWLDSEYMELEEALPIYHEICRQARRGFRPFPDLIDTNGNIIK